MDLPGLVATLDGYAEVMEERGFSPYQIILEMHHLLTTSDDKFNVEVKKSPLHGKGVFATAKIKKHDILTFYPSHTLYITDAVVESTEYYDTDSKRPLRDLEYGYTQFSDKSYTIMSLGDPIQTMEPALLAHMVNDFLPSDSKINFLPESGEKLIKEWARYEELREELSNAHMVRHKYHTYIAATKDIEAGEEVLVGYGYPFWVKVEQDVFDKLLAEGFAGLSESADSKLIDLIKKSGYDGE
jgi:hypothetical protein